VIKSVLCALFLTLGGCATAGSVRDTAMPRAAASLEAAKEFYVAVCLPVAPVGKEAVCAAGKAAVNDLVDAYNAVNSELPE
jgi:hypothetical protein